MKFKITDRLNLMQALPATGSYDELCIVRIIYEKVNFSNEDKKKYNIQFLPQGIQTDPAFDGEEFEIALGSTELDFVVNILNDMNSEGKLNIGLIELFELFMPPAGAIQTEDKIIENLEK